VTNAGIIKWAPLLKYKNEDWENVLDFNLNGFYYLSQAVAKEIAKQKNWKIINVASMLPFQGGKFVPSYTASKHGVAGLQKRLPMNYARTIFRSMRLPQGILRLPILPQFVRT